MCKSMAAEAEFRTGHIPHLFRCPISLDLMSDPVTVCTGQTYDRMSIERWLGTGNQTCPVTRQPLGQGLTPNHTLLRLIRVWGKSGNGTLEEVSVLVGNIVSHRSTRKEKVEALRRLTAGLARESEENRRSIVSGVPDLVPALLLATFSGSGVWAEALSVLVSLPLTKTQLDSIAESPSRLDLLSEFLCYHDAGVRANAMLLVEALAASSDPSCAALGRTGGLIDGLTRLITSGHAKIAVRALFSTCRVSLNRATAVAAGAPAALLDCLFCEPLGRSDSERALVTLELLCKAAEGRESIAQNALVVPTMKKLILKVSNQASESAAAVLLAVCVGSEGAQAEALSEGVFAQLLLLLQSGCSPRAKKKARVLLKLLRGNWPSHYCIREAAARSEVIPF